jgi:hypothetical protein
MVCFACCKRLSPMHRMHFSVGCTRICARTRAGERETPPTLSLPHAHLGPTSSDGKQAIASARALALAARYASREARLRSPWPLTHEECCVLSAVFISPSLPRWDSSGRRSLWSSPKTNRRHARLRIRARMSIWRRLRRVHPHYCITAE